MGFVSKYSETPERKFIGQYADTHRTAKSIALRYGVSPMTVIKRFPPPDIICPTGNRARLWSLETIEANKHLLGKP